MSSSYVRSISRIITLLIIGVLALSLSACAFAEREADPAYVSPYDWSNLVHEGGRCYYYKNGLLASKVGIDASSHQGSIDWESVAGDGIEFAMIRVGNRGYTEGMIYLDEQYHANIDGASSAGIEVGVYFFSQAVNETEAREEADFVLENLAGRKLEYPVAYDHEPVADANGRANGLSRAQLTANAQAFCTRIEEAGYTAILYGNKQDIARFDMESLGNYDVWFAEYDAEIPSARFDFIMWQHSSNGSVSGIVTRVDMNIHFLTA